MLLWWLPCYFKQVTDASLLTITGFPAFAVGDESLCQQAKDMVVEKLEVRIRKVVFVQLVVICIMTGLHFVHQNKEYTMYTARICFHKHAV